MRRLLLVGFCLLLLCGKTFSQGLDLADAFGLDSARIEGMWDTWSLRALTTVKVNRFSISHNSNSVGYTPNNPLSAGFGMTYKFISLDLGFNIKGSEPNPTKRFDAVISFGLNRSYASIGYQRFKGFEVDDNKGIEYPFRSDVRTQIFEVLYRYSWPERGLSLKALLAGLQVQDKSTGVFTFGGYGFWDQIKADSSLIPLERIDDFPSKARANFSSQFSLGGTVGYAYSLVLPLKTFVLAGVSPGLGLNFGRVEGETNFTPTVFPGVKLEFWGAVGYAGPKIYVIFSMSGNVNAVNWKDGVQYGYTIVRTKLSVGYRFSSEIAVLEKIADGIRNAARRSY